MIGWKDIIAGAVTFSLAHAIEVEAWPWFDPAGATTPWFLNAGRATAFTAACLAVLGVIYGAIASSSGYSAIVRGCSVAMGAILAMTFVLFVNGPGTLFPIVLVVGAAITVASTVSGAMVGRGLISARRARRT